MFFLYNAPERSYYQKTAFGRHFFNMAAQAAAIRGGKVEIWHEHTKIYKIATKLPENFPGKNTK